MATPDIDGAAAGTETTPLDFGSPRIAPAPHRGGERSRMQSGYREDAVPRAYYAILHAAKAALFVHDVEVAMG